MKVTDQMGREVELPDSPPKRIISLVPSQTELLHDLGLDEEVVGITKFCVHPEHWYQHKPKVGGTKMVMRKSIDDLNPDLIIGNKEENTPRDINRLEKKYPVWMSDVVTMEDAIEMIAQIGKITKTTPKSNEIIQQIERELSHIEKIQVMPTSIAYFIWKDPWMVVGNDTFIHHFCKKTGFHNVFDDVKRYPEIEIKEIVERKPDYVFLSSEPFPFEEKHKELLSDYFPKDRIKLIDGQMFSWYGSRLINGIQYANKLRTQLNENDAFN